MSFFVFALYERKNEQQKKMQYRWERSQLGRHSTDMLKGIDAVHKK